MAQQQEKSYIHAGNRKSNPHWIWGQIADLFVKSGRTIEEKPSNRRLVGQIRKNSVKEDIFEVSQVKKIDETGEELSEKLSTKLLDRKIADCAGPKGKELVK